MQTDSSRALEEELFSQRKKDHVRISLGDESQARSDQFVRLQLEHNPLPEIDLADVSLDCDVFGHPLKSPLFVSSMTLGHQGAQSINETLMTACQKRGWMMGVGSQRRQLFDPSARLECEELRVQFPDLVLFGNIGLSQVISSSVEDIESLVEALKAQFLVVHTNPLQEALQPEGTPQFRGGIESLVKLCSQLSVPVVLKETGSGFSRQSLIALKGKGLAAVDVSGLGGTHWGRVEGLRQNPESLGFQMAQSFANWGVSTVDSVMNAVEAQWDSALWASGGVRSGVDAAKLICLGAEKIGMAQPLLEAATESLEKLLLKMEQMDQELKVSLFCLGLVDVKSLVGKRMLLRWK